MKVNGLSCAIFFTSVVIGVSAHARSIKIAEWTDQYGSFLGFFNSSSVTFTASPFGLAGVNNLSFSPGTEGFPAGSGFPTGDAPSVIPGSTIATHYPVNTAYPVGPNWYVAAGTERAWGGDADFSEPNAQVIIDPFFNAITDTFTTANTFSVEFNYRAGIDVTSGVASLTVNNMTYTAVDPGALSQTTGILTFINGVLQDTATHDILGTAGHPGPWIEAAAVGAPEMNPASTVGAITLLSGGLAVLFGARVRRRLGQSIDR